MKKGQSLRILFDKFYESARRSYTQERASNIWNIIRDDIPDEYNKRIRKAWFDYELGQGKDELERVCNEFKERHLRR